jgi:hypothetical protein
VLAIRIVGDEEKGDGFPEFCSLCGQPSNDYLLTPWEHLNVCDDCMSELALYCRVWSDLKKRGIEPHASDFDRNPIPYIRQATSS